MPVLFQNQLARANQFKVYVHGDGYLIHILVSFPRKDRIDVEREKAHRFVISEGRTPEGHQLGPPLKKFSRSTKLSQLGQRAGAMATILRKTCRNLRICWTFKLTIQILCVFGFIKFAAAELHFHI